MWRTSAPRLAIPEDPPTASLTDARGREIHSGPLKLDAFGMGALDAALPAETTRGMATLTVRAGGSTAKRKIRIADFQRSDVRLTVLLDRRRGRATVRSTYAWGAPLEGAVAAFEYWKDGTPPAASQSTSWPTRTRLAADGTAGFDVTPGQRFRVTVRVPGRRGAPECIDAILPAPAESKPAATQTPAPARHIRLDKPVYGVGDEATVRIRLPDTKRASTWLFIGDTVLYDAHRIALQRGEGTVRLPVKVAYAPHTYCYVIGVAEPVKLVVTQPALNIAATFGRSDYEPGDTARLAVKTTDHEQRPADARLSVAVVDERIYQVREDDTPPIASTLYPESDPSRADAIYGVPLVPARWGSYETWSRGEVSTRFGHAALENGVCEMRVLTAFLENVDEEFFGARMGAGRSYAVRRHGGAYRPKRAEPLPPVRIHFPDVCLWRSDLRTGPDGRTWIDVPLPDAVTGYRVTLHGCTKDTAVGSRTVSIPVVKKLFAKIRAPKCVVAGDQVTFYTDVINLTGRARDVTVEMKASGMRLAVPGPIRRTAPAGGTTTFTWAGRVVDEASVSLEALARADDLSDRIRVTVPVADVRVPKRAVLRGSFDASHVAKLALPHTAVCGTLKVRVYARRTGRAPSSDLDDTLEALEHLATFPHGCVEQTMSRFLPNLAVIELKRKLGLRDEGLEKRLEKNVTAGLAKLYGYQKKDGAWGWFDRDAPDPFMTAYVVYGLARARGAGHAVRDEVVAGGCRAVDAFLEKERDGNRRAFLLFARARGGDAAGLREKIAKIARARGRSPYATACLALAAHAAGLGKEAGTLAAELEAAAIWEGDTSHWKTGNWYYKWEDVSAETTGFALMALSAVRPESRDVPRASRWLARGLRGGAMKTTKDKALAVLGIAAACSRGESLAAIAAWHRTHGGKPPVPFEVSLDEGRTWRKSAFGGRSATTVSFDAYDIPGIPKNMHFRCPGRKVAFRANVLWNGKGTPPACRKSRLAVATSFAAGGPTTRLADEREVVVRLHAGQEYKYALVEVPVGAGFEVVRDSAQGPVSHFEARHGKALLYLSRLPKGHTALRFQIRARYPGRYRFLPATAWLMYAPETRAGGSSHMHSIPQ
jgi:uncharacterized protein YfaS (alpha-2-macroglobulin family)